MAPKHQQHEHAAGTRSIASASISFGLVSIPVRIVSTSEHTHEVHFHMIHAGCGERLKQQYVCPTHGKVEREDIAKGYELRKGVMIELSPKELDALDAVADEAIALVEFVPAAAVDPIFVERTYYLEPGRGGARPYRLLRDALAQAKLVGIARYAARGNSYVVMVRPYETGLAMHQLRYLDEIKPWPGVDALPEPKSSELALARQLIGQLEHDELDMAQYRDEVKDRVRDLLADKAKTGETIVAPEAPSAPHIPDLMAALRASLGGPEAAPRADHKPPAHRRRRAAPRARTHRAAHARSHAAARRAS
ncbi:MAG TPA: Ku protein [Kofleriaceae bacterium]|jgi:DNA end-binding protein Ku